MGVAFKHSNLNLFLATARIAAALLLPSIALTETGQHKIALYAGVGAELTHYDVDAGSATLVKRGSVTLPGNVQYAWPHPSRAYLYVGWSNADIGKHGVTTLRVDRVSGAIDILGEPVSLVSRPVHLTVDVSGSHLLVAYNHPSGLTVHSLRPDGSIASEVNQPAGLDTGVYAHQVRVDPSNQMVILVTRGNGPAGNQPEDPGALKIFGYKDGLLTNRASIAPDGGFNFQPRHHDFHPTRPWVFVSLERQNKLHVYERVGGQTLRASPLFVKDSLADPGHAVPTQAAGTVHVDRSGKFVYQANRADGADFKGRARGENSIAVYAINQDTGEPLWIQSVDTRGAQPRTFALDPTGRLLIAANQVPFVVRDRNNSRTVPASLAIFRVGADGKLEFIRKYDVETAGSKNLFWMGMLALP